MNPTMEFLPLISAGVWFWDILCRSSIWSSLKEQWSPRTVAQFRILQLPAHLHYWHFNNIKLFFCLCCNLQCWMRWFQDNSTSWWTWLLWAGFLRELLHHRTLKIPQVSYAAGCIRKVSVLTAASSCPLVLTRYFRTTSNLSTLWKAVPKSFWQLFRETFQSKVWNASKLDNTHSVTPGSWLSHPH